jgi:hypothetical protein
MPDIDVVADGIEVALGELLAAARNRNPRRSAAPAVNGDATHPSHQNGSNGGPAPIVPSTARAKRGPAADMRAKRERGSGSARRRADP